MKNILTALLLLLLTSAYDRVYGQTIYDSESLIRYDIATHKTDKLIPFDRPFTLMVPKVSGKTVDAVHAYEAKLKRGKRFLAPDIIEYSKDPNDTTSLKADSISVKDAVLRFKVDSDTLQIYFPALKPNKNFDVNIIRKLPANCKELLMKVNGFLQAKDIDNARKAYYNFRLCNIDKGFNRTYVSMNFPGYEALYEKGLKDHYDYVVNESNFQVRKDLTLLEIQGIEVVAGKNSFKQLYLMVEALEKDRLRDLQLGLLDIRQVYEKRDAPAMTDLSARLKNLDANIMYFDSLQHRVDGAMVRGVDNIGVGTQNVSIATIREKVNGARAGMADSRQKLSERMKVISASIDAEKNLRGGIYLVGNTVSSDLKTAGGNVLFLDAGLTNIVAPGVDGGAVYIPKLYWGVSIYFRPIDKNTRRGRFPPKSSLKPTKGADGPDYNIVTSRSIWQDLSLNVGFTTGSMQNGDFDNFYNNTSLLVGPAYRFARGFKVSAGTALLKRTSPNPVVSNKKVTASGYASLSVDIDFIQGLKDITSILFK